MSQPNQSQKQGRRSPARRRAALAVVMALVALLVVVGCGGSSNHATSRGGTELAVIRSSTLIPPSHAARRPAATRTNARRAPRVRYHQGPSRARFPGGAEKETTTRASFHPCALVTRAEAAAVLGRRTIKIWEAPQGPTCIYQPAGSKQFVTMSVESANLAAIRKRSRALGQVNVGGRPAFCVRYGSVMTYMPMSRGRTLKVTGPCNVGAGLASKALPRLPR